MTKLEPWYKVVTPRKEVREGRSFDPKEFAIHLEQVVSGDAPEDYRDPGKFFERTCFTRALKEHVGLIIKRLNGETVNTAPVLSLVTQFGGGKTHTLTVLYHIINSGKASLKNTEVKAMLFDAGIAEVPKTKIAVFVGSAWDPQPGRETPWLDIAYQLAGEEGVKALGKSAKDAPPGTDALQRLYNAAGGSVLILFDETLNFMNRHRKMAEPFYAYIQNLTISMTGTTRSALVMSLPRSQVEMTDSDLVWQNKITKIVTRVAKDLIANDEAEISEVIRKRLFEDLGNEKTRKAVAKIYADWCFERRNQLPPEWTMVDTSQTDISAKESLRKRFEACYPFHPTTLSVFQRKWQTVSHYQQTRGTLAMLAQWVSWAQRDGFKNARKEPLITIGSAPLEVQEFRASVLSQLGESRLNTPIETDISGQHSHARALDVDTKDALKDIHRRVGTAIFFESSGGMVNKVAHLPEIRFSLGEPDVDTTSIDSAAIALERKGFFIRQVGTDGFQVNRLATMKKVVNDKRASLDEEEIKKMAQILIKKAFEKNRGPHSIVFFPATSADIPDSPKLTIVVMDLENEWQGSGPLAKTVFTWSKNKGASTRLYPYSLVWCVKRPGKDLREKIETMLAWSKVKAEAETGQLGADIDRAEIISVKTKAEEAGDDAQDEVWASYRFVVICDDKDKSGLRAIDLGAGHASSSEGLILRIIASMKSEGLLNESVGAGYIQRNWPPALVESGAWPMSGLRKSFLDGSLDRLVDPDETLRTKIREFVGKGEFGLASGSLKDGEYSKLWYDEEISTDEVLFEPKVFLLTKEKAQQLKIGTIGDAPPEITEPIETTPEEVDEELERDVHLSICGEIPTEMWNRLGTKVLPKLKQASGLRVEVNITLELKGNEAALLKKELEQVLSEMGLAEKILIRIN